MTCDLCPTCQGCRKGHLHCRGCDCVRVAPSPDCACAPESIDVRHHFPYGGPRVAPSPTEPRCATCGQPDRGHDDSHGFSPSPTKDEHTITFVVGERDGKKVPVPYFRGPRIPSPVAPSPDAPGLRDLLREAIEIVHQTDSIRRHADPTDKTGWNVKGIETCGDLLCVESLAALAALPPRDALDEDRLARALWDALYPDPAARTAADSAQAIAESYARLSEGEA